MTPLERVDIQIEIEQAAADAANEPFTIASAARLAASHKALGTVCVEVHSDGTRYQMLVVHTGDITYTSDQLRANQLIASPVGRVLIVLLNFRRAWHFGPDVHPNYVKEKLDGTSDWDAAVIARFNNALHRELHR